MIKFLSYVFDRKFEFLSHLSAIAFGFCLSINYKLSGIFLALSILFDLLYNWCRYSRVSKTK